MNAMRKCFIGLALVVASLTSCQKEYKEPAPDHAFSVRFRPVVQETDNILEFGKTYTNFFNEPFEVRTFKFYVHDIKLINTENGYTFSVGKDEHFLVDAADTIGSRIDLKVPTATYNRISFKIGVDSVRNFSGAQTGALDPALGMFWTWNSGYIMAKLEGNSPVTGQPGDVFEYHIGGFKAPDNVVQQVSLPFPSPITLRKDAETEIIIAADVYRWFNGVHDIRLDTNPVVMSPGPLAKKVSENYANMFTVLHFISYL
jgi:hypothetical protein